MKLRITKSTTFLFCCCSWILGVGLATALVPRFVVLDIFFIYVAVLVGAALLIWQWRKPYWRLFVLGGIFLFLGMWRYQISLPTMTPDEIHFYHDRVITFQGKVAAEPDVRRNHVKITVKSEQMLAPEQRPLQGKVLAFASLFPEYQYGDKIEISCRLQAPENAAEFSYQNYLASSGIYTLCLSPQIKFLGASDRLPIIKYILTIKKFFAATINRILPEPQAAFLGGLLYGARRGIPDDLLNAFQRTGTSHIIAISGFNITIIAAMVLKLCQGFYVNRKTAFWVVLGGLCFFVIFTGGQASVIRAAIMAVLVLFAQQIGRLRRITNALVFAAAGMLFFNPKVLVFDPGFQLSFLATISLIYFSPLLAEKLKTLPALFGVKEAAISTIAAVIFTTPLILFYFGRLSIIAPIANILILPLIPLTMAVGFVVGLAGIIWLQIGQWLGYLSWLLLSYIILVAEQLSRLSLASIELGRIPWWLIFIFYGVLCWWIWIKRAPPKFSNQ